MLDFQLLNNDERESIDDISVSSSSNFIHSNQAKLLLFFFCVNDIVGVRLNTQIFNKKKLISAFLKLIFFKLEFFLDVIILMNMSTSIVKGNQEQTGIICGFFQ
jgi:hypothetical protein